VGGGHLRIKTNFEGFRLPSLFKKCLEMISVEPSGQWAIVFFAGSKLSSCLRGSKQEKRITLTSFLKSRAAGSGVWLLLGSFIKTLEMASTEFPGMSEG